MGRMYGWLLMTPEAPLLIRALYLSERSTKIALKEKKRKEKKPKSPHSHLWKPSIHADVLDYKKITSKPIYAQITSFTAEWISNFHDLTFLPSVPSLWNVRCRAKEMSKALNTHCPETEITHLVSLKNKCQHRAEDYHEMCWAWNAPQLDRLMRPPRPYFLCNLQDKPIYV